MNKIIRMANTFKVGQTFDKLVDFLPALGVGKVPVQRGAVDVLDGQLTVWWPRNDSSQGWVNDKLPDAHMNYREIQESNLDVEKNIQHLNQVIESGAHYRLVFFREQYFNKARMCFAGKSWLRYYGLYKLDVAASKSLQKLVWKQVEIREEEEQKLAA